jgi:CBS domain-containing protein
MICPNCGYDNLPGSEECSSCQQDLTQLDRPIAQNRIERSLMEDPVSVLAPKKAVTVPVTATVREAVQAMLANRIGALLVVQDDGQLAGIFSERDLLVRVAGMPDPELDMPVRHFMTHNPETVTSHDTLAFALHKMDVGGYRHLPVIKDGKPVAVISVRDMLRHITRLCKDS